MPTIKEVSRHAKVSPATVSRVLNGTVPVAGDTKKRVLDAVKELNYQPNAFARGLVTNRSGGVGVVVNEISSPFYSGIVAGIEQVVEAADMHLIVSSGHADTKFERRAAEYLLQRRSDALILHLEMLSDYELLSWLEQNLPADTPVVIVGRNVTELVGKCVYLDNERGGFLATRYLLDQGHKHIAHIAGPMAMKDSRDRLQGYRRALEDAGLSYDESYVVEADFTENGGQQAVQRLLDRDLELSAIFSANDQMAAGILHTLREHNLTVPDDISLVGYDDVYLARYLYPALTTIQQPLHDMGRAAAHIALAALEQKETEVKRRFEPELIIRQSVKRPE